MFSSPHEALAGFRLAAVDDTVRRSRKELICWNTRSFHGGPINNETVGQLTVKWVYQTVPTPETANSAQGSVSSTPAVDGRYLYFNDMSGYLTKLDRFTGKLIWRKSYVNDLSVPGFVVKGSRNTPQCPKETADCRQQYGAGRPPLPDESKGPRRARLGCRSGDGASFSRSISGAVKSSGERKRRRILHRKSRDRSAGTAT